MNEQYPNPVSKKINTKQNILMHDKNIKPSLCVTIDGKKFNEKYANATFVAVLEYIGLEKVEALNLKLCSSPLVSKKQLKNKSKNYHNPKKSGKWFIVTHASKDTLKKKLEKIAEKLNIMLAVKIIR